MRLIALMALAASVTLFGGPLAGWAASGECHKDMQTQATDWQNVLLSFPNGTRKVVSDQWPDAPTSMLDPQERITETVYGYIGKLSEVKSYDNKPVYPDDPSKPGTIAINLTVVPLATRDSAGNISAADQKKLEDLLKVGIYREITVEPKTILFVKNYTPKSAIVKEKEIVNGKETGKVLVKEVHYFTVPQFATFSAPSNLSAHELRSLTDLYCVVQFTFQATFDRSLWPLFDTPDSTLDRRVRLLNRWDPFQRKWILVANNHEPVTNGVFKKDNVGTAVQNLSLTQPP